MSCIRREADHRKIYEMRYRDLVRGGRGGVTAAMRVMKAS